MKFLTNVLLWGILLVLCWPLALMLILLYPLIWLLALPFRILGVAVSGIFNLIEAIVMLPFKIVGVSRK
jgi:hypothetical protein